MDAAIKYTFTDLSTKKLYNNILQYQNRKFFIKNTKTLVIQPRSIIKYNTNIQIDIVKYNNSKLIELFSTPKLLDLGCAIIPTMIDSNNITDVILSIINHTEEEVVISKETTIAFGYLINNE